MHNYNIAYHFGAFIFLYIFSLLGPQFSMKRENDYVQKRRCTFITGNFYENTTQFDKPSSGVIGKFFFRTTAPFVLCHRTKYKRHQQK